MEIRLKALSGPSRLGDLLLVEDFESHTDDDAAGQAIWQHWIDGFGIADNGAQVGYLLPPYAQQTIVHGGSQSMPLLYTNETGGTRRLWRISLSAFADQGINLSNVDEIAIGLGSKSGTASAGGSGTMFIDDIRLYRQ